MSNRNQEIVDLFDELVRLTTLDEGGPASFRVRAYENAARELSEYRGDLQELSESKLTKIDGVGKSSAKKIREYFETGRVDKLEKLRAKYPPEFVELTKVPGLGPKSVLALRERLGIDNIEALRKAIEAEQIRTLEGFGKKSEENIAKALERMGASGKNRRRPIATTLPLAERLVERLVSMKEVERATYCGSLRRFRETIGDIDIVAVSVDPEPVMSRFVEMEGVAEVLGHGDTKSSIVTEDGFQVDLRIVSAEQYGAAILYFTGSKAFNIKMRQRAIARGWTLNEYGLTEVGSEKVVASASEQEIFDALDMAYVPPPMREDHGEVEASISGTMPHLVDASSLVADLCLRPSLENTEEVVAAARERGLVCIGILESAPGGRADQRHKLLVKLRKSYADMRILHGCEVEIDGDGTVDDEGTGSFDYRIGRLMPVDVEDQTGRIINALKTSGCVAVAGLSGRQVGTADGLRFDAEEVARTAADSGVAIVVDARLDHLDPPADALRRMRGLGARFLIGSMAINGDELRNLNYGAEHCLRGWVDGGDVLNNQSLPLG